MEEKEEIIKKLSAYFLDKSDVRLALLFGSFAKNKFSQKSDVDIAVDFSAKDDSERTEKWLSMRAQLELLLHRDIDLLDLSKCDGLILTEIITNCERIKNNPDLFAEYNLKVIYFNEDFLPLLNKLRRKNIERFING